MGSTSNQDELRVTFIARDVHNSLVENVYHVQFSADAGPRSDDDTRADMLQFMSNIVGYLTTFLSTTFVFEGVDVYNVTQDRPLGMTNFELGAHGSASGDELPPQVAASCFFRTGFPRCVGRKFFGGLTETGNTTEGVPAANLLAAVALAVTEILVGYTLEGIGFYNVGVGATASHVFRPFIEGVVRGFFKTQRRRVPGIGA